MRSGIAENQKAKIGETKFDVEIVFGYGPVLPGRDHSTSSGRLNTFGHLNAIAAGMLYQIYQIKRIIPTGGKTGGSERQSEAELIANIIQKRFNVSRSIITLEERSKNTIQNLVYVVNILDGFGRGVDKIFFVGMGFHLPQIQEICTLVGLEGKFVAAGDIVCTRSDHHLRMVLDLLNPELVTMIEEAKHQKRMLHKLRFLPELWLPEIAKVSNPKRLLTISREERVQRFIQENDKEVRFEDLEEFRNWMLSIS